MQNVKSVAIISGARTPFTRVGTSFKDYRSIDLTRELLKAFNEKSDGLSQKIDEFIFGTVLLDSKIPNLAREALFQAGYSKEIPAHFISNNCISGLVAVNMIREGILSGRISSGLAGGVEAMSLPSLGLRQSAEKMFVNLSRAKTFGDKFSIAMQFRPKHFFPIPPSPKEPSTGLTMGEHCEITAKEYKISRAAQDEVALKSHKNAAKSFKDGILQKDTVSIAGIIKDNLVREDTSIEKLAKLSPVFDKSSRGTITAGNASPLTDGASVVLLGSEKYCTDNNLKPLGFINAVEFAAISPDDGLLMAPGVAVPRLLAKTGLTIADFDIFEIHEAFSAQVLANMKVWKEGWGKYSIAPIGEIPEDKINVCGGSIAIGHPFAATGGRLILGALRELERRGGKRALISVCAAGGMAAAVVVER